MRYLRVKALLLAFLIIGLLIQFSDLFSGTRPRSENIMRGIAAVTLLCLGLYAIYKFDVVMDARQRLRDRQQEDDEDDVDE